MSCALCKAKSPLQNSHIIPEFFYTSLYDTKHRFCVIPTDSSAPENFNQKGIREKLLCRACEQKFSVWESYVKRAFCDGEGINIRRERDIFKLTQLDYHKFRLFLLSLLWRMGVSKLDFFSLVSLGSKHEEFLRSALVKEDPLEPLQYPCLMVAVRINNQFQPDWISQPMRAKSNGQRCHCVVAGGIFLNFYVARNTSLPTGLALACINKLNEMQMSLNDIQDIPMLAEYASAVGRGIRRRKLASGGSG